MTKNSVTSLHPTYYKQVKHYLATCCSLDDSFAVVNMSSYSRSADIHSQHVRCGLSVLRLSRHYFLQQSQLHTVGTVSSTTTMTTIEVYLAQSNAAITTSWPQDLPLNFSVPSRDRKIHWQPRQNSNCGMTNYPIGPNRTTSDLVWMAKHGKQHRRCHMPVVT